MAELFSKLLRKLPHHSTARHGDQKSLLFSILLGEENEASSQEMHILSENVDTTEAAGIKHG